MSKRQRKKKDEYYCLTCGRSKGTKRGWCYGCGYVKTRKKTKKKKK
jgi:hypothetical protein